MTVSTTKQPSRSPEDPIQRQLSFVTMMPGTCLTGLPAPVCGGPEASPIFSYNARPPFASGRNVLRRSFVPHSTSRTVRDPLWQNVHLDAAAAAVVDTPEFQRLRRVKQLGFAHLVYPGAVHNRFLHALGVYHLTGRAIETLERKGELDRLDDLSRRTIPEIKLAALLHDVGHYAFSHAMEELEPEAIPGHHEEVADHFLESPGIRAALDEQGAGAVQRIGDLIRGRSLHPLQGLVSGSLDLDKIDYLRRDSLFCGVPYGAVDVERLLESLTLARESAGSPLEVAVTEKGLSALESLDDVRKLFADGRLPATRRRRSRRRSAGPRGPGGSDGRGTPGSAGVAHAWSAGVTDPARSPLRTRSSPPPEARPGIAGR